MRRRDEKKRRDRVKNKGGVHIEPTRRGAQYIRNHAGKRFPSEMWNRRTDSLWLDHVPQNVAMQPDIEQRARGHDYDERTYCQSVHRILAPSTRLETE